MGKFVDMTDKIEIQIGIDSNEVKLLFEFLDEKFYGIEENCEVFLDKQIDRSGGLSPEIITAIITASSTFLGVMIKSIFDYLQGTSKVNLPFFKIRIKNGENEIEGEFPIGISQNEIEKYFQAIDISKISKLDIEKIDSNRLGNGEPN